MRNLNHLGLIPRVLNDFQRGIKGSGSSRHCHLEAVPHFRKPVSASSARDPAIPVGWSVKVEQLRTSYKPFTVYSMISLNDPSHAANTTQVSWAAESLPHQSFAGILQSMASWANRWCWRQWHWKETPSRCSQSDSKSRVGTAPLSSLPPLQLRCIIGKKNTSQRHKMSLLQLCEGRGLIFFVVGLLPILVPTDLNHGGFPPSKINPKIKFQKIGLPSNPYLPPKKINLASWELPHPPRSRPHPPLPVGLSGSTSMGSSASGPSHGKIANTGATNVSWAKTWEPALDQWVPSWQLTSVFGCINPTRFNRNMPGPPGLINPRCTLNQSIPFIRSRLALNINIV